MNAIEFQQIDKTFNESMFITKVNNIFVKLLTSIMFESVKEVDHFIGDEVYNWADNKVKELQANNQRQMYDELNVGSSKITNIESFDDSYSITVQITANYMDYIIDKDDARVVKGQNNSRITSNYLLTFTKYKNAREQSVVKKCSNCGASMDVNNSGICEFCGSVYNQEAHDWVLTKFTKI